MNFEHHIYQYLLKYKKVEVPDFGVFVLRKESAKIDSENSIISPPKEIVSFLFEPNVSNNSLTKYISEKTNSNLFIVQIDLKNELAKWVHTLQVDKVLVLSNLGKFQINDQNQIVKISEDTNDLFGLEAINLNALKQSSSESIAKTNKIGFKKNVFWFFLFLIALIVASIFVFGNKELILGSSPKSKFKKTEMNIELKKRSTPIIKDSIQIDSLK